MLSNDMLNILNEQIGEEFYSSNLYLQMSAWAQANGFTGTARFLHEHAAEELSHGLKFFDFINETGAMAIVPALAAPPQEFSSLLALFEQILEHEKHITKKVYALANLAHDQKDFFTFNFLQYFITEQHEEENLFKGILDRVRMIGMEGRGLFLIDKEIGKLQH